ncbi:hypothetical protein Ddye_000085 [Dipteronia dyeriana]|uniref:Endonuclease/exonuclease/phosphatase domain-containing protein n=1 Tax=Dipteronia dyeriana TaxID=168575 RepID=A0AAE0CS90_9ROSI|nr:hypothetical protein Ddye_000085 [Dipteronia dyeriana]
MADFREAIEDSQIEDIGFRGPNFTLSNKKKGNSLVIERLDKGVCNKKWRILFPNFDIRHLEFLGSDHRPLLLGFSEALNRGHGGDSGHKRRFYFEECWADDEECQEIVSSVWEDSVQRGNLSKVLDNIRKCGNLLNTWNMKKCETHRKDIVI